MKPITRLGLPSGGPLKSVFNLSDCNSSGRTGSIVKIFFELIKDLL